MKRNKSEVIIIFLAIIFIINISLAFSSSPIDEIISDLNNSDWIIRSRAIDDLIQIIPGKGREIKPEYRNNEQLREALINLLETESKKGLFPGEAYAEYESMLISAVSSLKDERALPLFLGTYFAANSDAERFLIEMEGEQVINGLLSHLSDKGFPGKRAASLRIIQEKLKRNKIEKRYKDRIKKSVIRAIKDGDHSVRLWAVRTLAYYESYDLIPLIESIAETDDYSVMRKNKSGVPSRIYPVREEAQKILNRFHK